MRHVIFAVTLACAAPLGGCVPMTYIDSFPMSVHVADSVSGKPVVGAVVTYMVRFEPERRQTARTDGTGTADLPGMSHRRWLPLLPIDYIVPEADIAVDAGGYAARSVPLGDLPSTPNPRCGDKPGCPPLVNLGIVALPPKPH